MAKTNEQLEALIKNLCSLVQLDIDAVHAYDQAIGRMEATDVREHLVSFREDHARHIEELSGAVRRLGGDPPAFEKDFKGYVIEGFTALQSMAGPEGALRAMKANEKLTNKTYRQAMGWAMTRDIYDIVRRARENEARHLAYIERALRERLFEVGERAA